jgi:hypothetical protein
VDIETTQDIAERFLKWTKWFLIPASVLLAVLGLVLALLGISDYSAFHKAIQRSTGEAVRSIKAVTEDGKSNIADATKNIGAIKQNADDLGKQVNQLRSEFSSYKEVNSEMERLQKQFHGQTNDLSKLDLRVHSLETLGSGENTAIGLGPKLGCPAAPPGQAALALCAQGTPPLFYQLTAGGIVRPISSLSPVGFQDASTAPRPDCTASKRGTFYVEKGTGKIADKALLCVRQSDNMA